MPQTSTCITILVLLLSSMGGSYKTTSLMEEICNNGIDDNGDGLIDLNDPDCECEIVSFESLFPNPSFEDYSCCPETDSQLNCVDGWIQASGATTDYLNTCNYTAVPNMTPYPDGDGALLIITGSQDFGMGPVIYKEYAGAFLNEPMQKDSTYTFKFHLGFIDAVNSPEINFSFFGSPSSDNLPFSIGADCPTNYPDWFLLKTEYVDSDGIFPNWIEVTTTIRPTMDINSLVIGGDCLPGTDGTLSIYLIDNLRLNEESNFDFELIEEGSPCDPAFAFAVTGNPDFTYQWYKEGIALIGESGAALSQMYDEGAYQLRMIDGNGQCRITEDFIFEIPVLMTDVHEIICEGESLIFQDDVIDEVGIYDYVLTSVEGCDSIITLTVEEDFGVSDTIFARVLPGAVYNLGTSQFSDEGEYQIDLSTSNGCDSIIVLFLENIELYVPNIFSPNGDGVNDYFEIVVGSDELVMKEMSVYDRWGGLLYHGDKWDGTFNNNYVDSGVYVYFVRLEDITGHELVLSNSITVMR